MWSQRDFSLSYKTKGDLFSLSYNSQRRVRLAQPEDHHVQDQGTMIGQVWDQPTGIGSPRQNSTLEEEGKLTIKEDEMLLIEDEETC